MSATVRGIFPLKGVIITGIHCTTNKTQRFDHHFQGCDHERSIGIARCLQIQTPIPGLVVFKNISRQCHCKNGGYSNLRQVHPPTFH